MSPSASPTRRLCPRCGAPLPGGSEAGTELPCGSCLLLAGLGEEPPTNLPPTPEKEIVTVSDADMAPEPDGLGLQLGGYLLLRQLGQGSMGVIYEARQPGAGRPVALKTILRALLEAADARTRFAREAEAAASLDHPNLLPVYEVGEDAGRPFFTMKLAEGGSLLGAMPRYAGRPREAVALMAKVARGLAHAHGCGVLHRDLKPGNVLLDADGETPLVADFGLARWLDRDSDLTQSLVVFGTPGYMAPEQARHAGRAGPAADIYSMGAMLFQLLCGRPPFRGGNAIEVIEQARAGPAPSLRAFNPKAARDLETICARCLEFEPSRRPRCAADLAEDLEGWLAGRPIRLRPVRWPERVWRWTARNPWLAGAAAGCLLLGGVAVARHRESRRLDVALREEEMARNSVVILPFLDLDKVRPDTGIAVSFAAVLREQIAPLGSARINDPTDPLSGWTGMGTEGEVLQSAPLTKSRAVLAGVYRRLASNRLRLTLRLLSDNGTTVLGHWAFEVDSPAIAQGRLHTSEELGAKIYQAMVSLNQASSSTTVIDPAATNEMARGFIMSGKGLMGRRTIADMDRAIACFEGAIRVAPRSVTARCYLAMACMGRDQLGIIPGMPERASQVAQEAEAIAPEDPEVHRALCWIYGAQGHYREALEHGLRAVESGDPSERAFGQIAFCQRMLGRPDLALRWYQKAKKSERQPADYEVLMADCWSDLVEDDRARQAYEAADQLQPDLPDGWIGLCRLQVLAGGSDAARDLCNRRLPNFQGSRQGRQIAAQVEFFARNFPAAERLYTALREEDAEGGGMGGFYGTLDYGSALAKIRLAAGDSAGAVALLQECLAREQTRLTRSPQNATALYRLAAAEAMLGHLDEAVQHLAAATEAGWVDFRSLKLDPRFDTLVGDERFRQILSGLVARAAGLRRQQPAGEQVVSKTH